MGASMIFMGRAGRGYFRTAGLGLLLLSTASCEALAQSPYVEPGKPGDPTSWRTTEFNADWGLNAMKVQYAYARGFTGAGVKVGEVDSGVFNLHPEFAGRLVTLTSTGNYYADGYKYRTAGNVITGTWTAGQAFSVGGQWQ